MFDIGFSEMVVLAVVALVVLGPERLPKVAKQGGQWLGKMRRYVDDVKSDINRQMELSELRKLQAQVTDAAKDLEKSVTSSVAELQTEVDDLNRSLSSETPKPVSDWDTVYAIRRQRERIRDRRIERERELGFKRPKRRFYR
ncbi:MAG: Sec-independent protein translocase protein TatB [Burkholderiales bacterium]|jgi:sec-independent protein translocase protein TatB